MRMQHYHAQVGHDVSRTALEEVFGRLVVEARMKFHQRKYDEALQVFKHCLAVAEKTTTKGKHAEYGALMHNIASCLHCLGDFPAAKVRTRAWLRRRVAGRDSAVSVPMNTAQLHSRLADMRSRCFACASTPMRLT